MIISKLWNYLEDKEKGFAGAVTGAGAVAVAFAVAFAVAVAGAVAVAVALIWYILLLGLTSLFWAYPSFIPIWMLILSGIILGEILILFETKKKNPSLKWTAKKKFENYLEAFCYLGILNLLRLLIKYLNINNFQILLKWVGYVGVGILALALIIVIGYVLIKLNQRMLRK